MTDLYVNVYEVDRAYGGPEEGGWWFDVGEVIESHRADNQAAAEVVRELLREKFPRTGKRSSVLGGEDYEVMIEDNPGENYPTERPRYE